MATLYRPLYRRNPSLAEVTPESMVDIVLGRLPEGHRAILLPYRSVLIPRVAQILAEARAERQRELDAQLPPEAPTGGMVETLPVLPAEENEGGTKGTGLHGWEVPAGATLYGWRSAWGSVYDSVRKELSRFPGGPFTIKKQVDPSTTHPGYLDARVTIKAGNKQDYARGVFTFVPEGAQGPLGFIPNGVTISSLLPDGKEISGLLDWTLRDRSRSGTPPYVRRYSKGVALSRDAWVTVQSDPEDAATVMALLVAYTNAEACRHGDTERCLQEPSAFLQSWPPKARAKSGVYTPKEFDGIVSQIKDLPEVVAAYAYFDEKVKPYVVDPSAELTQPPAISRAFGYDWHSSNTNVPDDLRTETMLKRLRTEEGNEEGRIPIDSPGLRTGYRGMLRTSIPGFVRQLRREADMIVAVFGQTDPEKAVEQAQKYRAHWTYLGEALKRLGYPIFSTGDKQPNYAQLLVDGVQTWKDYIQAGVDRYKETLWSPGTAAQYEAAYQVFARFVRVMQDATPGVYTHLPTRTRFLAQHDMTLEISRSERKIRHVRIEDSRTGRSRVFFDTDRYNWETDMSDETLVRAVVDAAQSVIERPFDPRLWPKMMERGNAIIKQEGKGAWPPLPTYGTPQDVIERFNATARRHAKYLLHQAHQTEQNKLTEAGFYVSGKDKVEYPLSSLQPFMAEGHRIALDRLFELNSDWVAQFNQYIQANKPIPLELWYRYRTSKIWGGSGGGGGSTYIPTRINQEMTTVVVPFDQLPTVLALTWDWINDYPQGTTNPKGLWIRQLLDLSYRDWPPKIT